MLRAICVSEEQNYGKKEYNPNAIMVIMSTIPVGYTVSIREKFGSKNIIFSPEFLRKSKTLHGNAYPKILVEFSWAMITGKIIYYCRKMRFRVQVWG